LLNRCRTSYARTTAKQMSPAKARVLTKVRRRARRGKSPPKFPDFSQDFLIDGYVAAI
jgi:hypothetical protein